jgi:hypothetical protein
VAERREVQRALSEAVRDEGERAVARIPDGSGKAAVGRSEGRAALEVEADDRRSCLRPAFDAARGEELPVESCHHAGDGVPSDTATLSGKAERRFPVLGLDDVEPVPRPPEKRLAGPAHRRTRVRCAGSDD